MFALSLGLLCRGQIVEVEDGEAAVAGMEGISDAVIQAAVGLDFACTPQGFIVHFLTCFLI